MDYPEIATLVLTSGVVAAIVSYFLNILQNKKMVLYEKKIKAIEDFAEITYRAKLAAFYEKQPGIIPVTIDHKKTLDDHINELIDALGKYNGLMGNSDIYARCHSYKNYLTDYKKQLIDRSDCNVSDIAKLAVIQKGIDEGYLEIEARYNDIKKMCKVSKSVIELILE